MLRTQSGTPRVHLLAALERERDERLHCSLLRWLLDPLETHGYGEAFLAALVADCGLGPITAALADAQARCEVRGIDSRIDVEVAVPNSFLIHIEAKIDHVEREDQTQDESVDLGRRCAVKRVPPESAQPIYLTRAGDSPSAANEGLVRSWRALTWQQVARVLRRPINERRHAQTTIIEHVLDCFEMLTTGGTMEPFKPTEIDRVWCQNRIGENGP